MKGKLTMVFGLALVLGGCLALYYGEIRYSTKESVLDVGPLKATFAEPKSISIHPAFSGLAVAGGVALVIAGARRTR